MDIDAALDELFAASLDAFVPTRDDLVKRLKDSGDSAGATAIKKIRKPVVSAWAINQAVRRSPEAAGELMASIEKLRDALSAEELRSANASRKEAIARVKTEAEKALADAGHGSSGSVMQRIESSLVAIPSDEDATALASGRLTAGIAGGSDNVFGALGSIELDENVVDEQRARDVQRAERLEKLAIDAEREARDRARELDLARGALERAEKAAELAWAKAEKARAEADAARDEL